MYDKKILVKLKFKKPEKNDEILILYNDLRLKKYYIEISNIHGKNSLKKNSYDSIKDAFIDLFKILNEKTQKPYEKYILNSDLENYKPYLDKLYKYLK